MTGLFDLAPPVAGLTLQPDIVTEDEERALADRIAALDLSPFRFQGWEGKRLTRSFGWHYDFVAQRLAEAEPIPDWLLPLRGRAAALAGVEPHALVIRYDAGAGIGWHRDRPQFDRVVGVSLLADEVLRLRRRRPDRGFDRAAVDLPRRSAYLLSGEVRRDWEHSLAPVRAQRLSITFRSLRS